MTWMRFQRVSRVLGMPVSFDVVVPEDAGGAAWKVLYLLHGAGGDRNEWMQRARLVYVVRECWRGDAPLAVVLPEGLQSGFVNTSDGWRFGDYLWQELPAYIEAQFPAGRSAEHRIVAGIGTGGAGALRAAREHPEVFGTAEAFDDDWRAAEKSLAKLLERLGVSK